MALLPTSGTYNFQSIQIELLIREAFENIGIFGEFVESQKLDSAKRSIDLLMLEWMSKSVNLWTLQYDYIPLVTSQAKYELLESLSDITQINLRTSTRQLNGTPTTNGTDGAHPAADAFDGNPNTYCNANQNDAWISYDYGLGNTQQINFVGLQAHNDTTDDPINILIQYSNTPNDNNSWVTLYNNDFAFTPGVTEWFDITTPVNARAYRVYAPGRTLQLEEIYFNNNIFDLPISEVSREEYFTYPNKQLQGRPSVYYIDRQLDSLLYVWPVPSSLYNCLQYSYKQMIQDAGNYTDALQIPARFYPALVNGLSWKLAVKFNPQMAQMFQAEYEKSFSIATIEDSENTPISIRGDTTYNYGR